MASGLRVAPGKRTGDESTVGEVVPTAEDAATAEDTERDDGVAVSGNGVQAANGRKKRGKRGGARAAMGRHRAEEAEQKAWKP